MCVGSVGVELQHLPVSISPVFHRHSSCSSRQFLLTQRDEGTVEPQPVLLADVVVVLHGLAFGPPAQRGLRDDQQAAGKLQHRRHLPRVGLTQSQVQQRGHWTGEERTEYLHLILRDFTLDIKIQTEICRSEVKKGHWPILGRMSSVAPLKKQM